MARRHAAESRAGRRGSDEQQPSAVDVLGEAVDQAISRDARRARRRRTARELGEVLPHALEAFEFAIDVLLNLRP